MTNPISISRRGVVAAGAVLATSAAAAGGVIPSSDPRASAQGQIKLQAALDGSPAFWLYSGFIYAVQPGQHPRAILAASGCQSSWAEVQADGSYIVTGATLTYFRDIANGAILDTFDNPLTGQQNTVTANFLSGARILYPADGSSARADFIPASGGAVAPSGFGKTDAQRPLGLIRWRAFSDTMMLQTDRSWNVATQPQLEAETQSCRKSEFFDPAVRHMKARYAGTTIIPWMRWMQMGDLPGHLIWHTSGEKDFSLAALEDDYRAKAGLLIDRFLHKP